MCAINDPLELVKIKSGKRTITAYKIIRKNGRPFYRSSLQPYGPGLCRVPEMPNKYDVDPFSGNTRGIHAYLRKVDAKSEQKRTHRPSRIIKIKIKPEHVVVLENAYCNPRQIVASQIEITQKDWNEAGFPHRVTKQRLI
ncbi:MAG: hypothetical protein JSW11_00810 [Candidatus Heimdallarchaeota archaeon]|nr:MAG: hypothetical protein JSW11_00810 [Candidatus Heimdallarchaeota archaeon]